MAGHILFSLTHSNNNGGTFSYAVPTQFEFCPLPHSLTTNAGSLAKSVRVPIFHPLKVTPKPPTLCWTSYVNLPQDIILNRWFGIYGITRASLRTCPARRVGWGEQLPLAAWSSPKNDSERSQPHPDPLEAPKTEEDTIGYCAQLSAKREPDFGTWESIGKVIWWQLIKCYVTIVT